MNVLVIEDDASFRHLLEPAIKSLGHEVTVARNGREGMEKFEEDQFDIVLTDIFMPEKEGLETISALRRRRPDIRIVAMSGGLADRKLDVLELARRLGAHAVLEKPFNKEQLNEAIESVKRRRKSGARGGS